MTTIRNRSVHTLLATALIGSSFAVATATPSASASEQPDRATVVASTDRGDLVSATRIRHLDIAATRHLLADAGYSTDEVRRPVDGYRLVYRTVDRRGRSIRASGLFAYPTSGPHRLRTVLFEHGTTPSSADAPSVGKGDTYQQAGALSFAAAGYAVAAPDYVGLGVGQGYPAYLDGRTEVSASVDLLEAARDFAVGKDLRLSRGVRVAGFSQGAHAALVTARTLQRGRVPRLRLTAVASISGAYDFRHAELPAILSGEVDPKLATLYLGYLLTSWDHLHGLYDSPSRVFRAPYDGFVTGLYDGTHRGIEVYKRMPATPQKLLTKAGLRMLRHPAGRFARALDEYDNACDGWTPRAPIRMYYTGGDREATPTNTLQCADDFARRGFAVRTRDLRVPDHGASGRAGVTAAIRWFDRLGR